MKPIYTAAAIMAAALCAARLPADIYGEWTAPVPDHPNLFHFSYEVTSLPDFDQVRLGLPNCGRCYCVPTASMNMSAYAANHGFPSIIPGPGPKTGIEITNALLDFGNRMSTHPDDGTTKGHWFVALAGLSWLPCPPVCPIFPRDVFTVTAQFRTDDYAPRMYAAAKTAIFNQGLMSLAHGWYKPLGGFMCNGEPVLYRDGGHALTVQKIDGYWYQGQSNYSAGVWLRDPASDEGNSMGSPCDKVDAINDSSPSVTGNSLELHSFSTSIFCSNNLRLDRLRWEPGEVSYRLVDGYMLVTTKAGYAFLDDLKVFVVHKPIVMSGSNGPGYEPIDLAEFDDVGDAVISPDMNEFVIVADNQLHIVDPLARSVHPVDDSDVDIPDPRSIVFGRRRGLYVVDGTDLVCVDLDRTPPAEVVRVQPPHPGTLVRYHDATDEVVLLSPESQSLLRYPWHLDAVPEEATIPASVPLAGDVSMTVDPRNGDTWIGNRASNEIFRLAPDPDGNLVATAYLLPGRAPTPEAIDMDDVGHLFVSQGGVMQELMVQDDELVPVPDSVFTGQPAGRIMHVTRSSTNYDEAVHGTEEWRDVLPEEEMPDLPDCRGDIAPGPGDGVVDAADLAAVLAAWGPCDDSCPADIVLDGQVDAFDLAEVLATWGECPVMMEPLTNNACETAPLVREGAFAFDTTDATTDGPGLPVECDEGTGLLFENDVWLLYVPSATGVASIVTCEDADFDTRLAVYTGSCGSLDLRACNDDGDGCGGGTSKIVLPVDPGMALFIRIGSSDGSVGTGIVTIDLVP